MAEAARREQQSAPETNRAAPRVQLDTPRPLPYAEPKALNDNAEPRPDAPQPSRRPDRRRSSPLRWLAWIVLLPLYLAAIAVSLGLIGLFVKDLFGL